MAEAPDTESPVSPDQTSPPPELELWLLRFLLASDEHVDWAATHLDLTWLQNSVLREIISARLAAHAEQSWNGVPSLLARFETGPARNLITQAVAENLPAENLSQKISDTTRRLRNDYIDRQLTALTRRLSEPGIAESDLINIETEKARLREQKKQPLR
jgi:hypothetical protein